MADEKEFLYNVYAFSDTVLENNKKKLDGIDFLIIKMTRDDGTYSIIRTKKEMLQTELASALKRDLSSFSDIDVMYENSKGELERLNGITIC